MPYGADMIQAILLSTRRHRQEWRRWAPWLLLALPFIVCAAVLVIYAVAGFFDAHDARYFSGRPRSSVAVVYLTGDMGLRVGTAPPALDELIADRVPVLAISTPTAFHTRRSPAFAHALLTQAIVDARRWSGASHILVIGQSYGADIAEIGLSRLTAAERAPVVRALLIVPGRDVYFRADPTGFTYRFAPDAHGGAAIARVAVPLVCVQGVRETDSSCPFATQSSATRIALPGGHSLKSDHPRINAVIRSAVATAFQGVPA